MRVEIDRTDYDFDVQDGAVDIRIIDRKTKWSDFPSLAEAQKYFQGRKFTQTVGALFLIPGGAALIAAGLTEGVMSLTRKVESSTAGVPEVFMGMYLLRSGFDLLKGRKQATHVLGLIGEELESGDYDAK